MPNLFEDTPEPSTAQQLRSELSAERAATAAEAASRAAQSTASAVERLGSWMAVFLSRTPQPSTEEAPYIARSSEVALFAVKPQEQDGGVAVKLQRAVKMARQRIGEVAEERFGLAVRPSKAEAKQQKKIQKRLEHQAWQEAKAEQPGANMKWFPWMLGMSIGLVIGLVGVAYWKRRQLQAIWQRTSHRVQQATGEMRHRLEESHQQQSIRQPDLSTDTPRFSPPSSALPSSEMNQQANGRMESTWQ
jgi:hypothetical protein